MTKIKFKDYGCLGNGWADVYINNQLVLTHLKGQDALDVIKVILQEETCELQYNKLTEYGGEGFINL